MLITGANVGIGKDVARQLALRPEIGRVYLACRNKDRATTARADLEAVTGRLHNDQRLGTTATKLCTDFSDEFTRLGRARCRRSVRLTASR